jgi:hypothetical protein
MNNYKRVNNLVGWIVFLIASFVYLSTIEPTGSFWDCGEFIASAHKMEVGHPPGAPFFMILARIFILLGGPDNVTHIPVMVNILSALMSAFASLFLCWSITAMGRKIAVRNFSSKKDNKAPLLTELPLGHTLAVMGAGLVGGLALTFCDSQWFSAVEGEVYSSSSFFTAIVVWLMFKWDNVADEKHNLRWIILIAYLMGLSIGVHLLNLLTIPALAFVYYFRKYTPTTKGILWTFILGCVILGFVQVGLIQGILIMGSKFELMFVNGFGLPFWSGFFFFLALVIGAIVWGLHYTKKKTMYGWNTAILAFAFILIGYSSFMLIPIRSAVEPPLDENNPDNAFSFVSYLNREQYGERPLLSGQYYNARVIDQKEGSMQYAKVEGESKYVEAGRKVTPVYEPNKTTVFPRMWSNQKSHIDEYKKWADIKGERTPTFSENLKFFFSYQVGEMYWRYFMWNFVGRQNDWQGPGGITKGNWYSGIKFIDEMRLGPQDKLPPIMKNNKAHNKLYFLPFILGFIGMFYHFTRDKHDAWIVMLLFFFTGMAIVIYLNGTPLQPRERDYAYAGSYYAFCFWIGLGVLQLYEWFSRKAKGASAAVIATALGLIVPVVMARAEWNDHDRSHRYTSRDFAADYLNSCAPNAIIFTNGDNDTFPLWYAQEVENIRTDVRVVNLSLLNTDWYTKQLTRKYYESEPIPIGWTYDKYSLGKRDYIQFYDRGLTEPQELKEIMDFMVSDDRAAKARLQNGEEVNYYPTKHFKITVDPQSVLASGTVSPENADKIVKVLDWTVDGNYLMKNDLMILNIIANNNWKRPIYWATTVGSENYLNLEPYFQLEGLAYRLVPIRTETKSEMVPGRVETSQMYNNVMNKFVFGNMNDERVYLDENNQRMTTNFRINFGRLAEELLKEGKRDSCVKVLDKCVEETPDKTVPYNYFMARIAELYYRAGGVTPGDTLSGGDVEFNKRKELTEKGNAILTRLAEIQEDGMNYYLSVKGTKFSKYIETEMSQSLYIMQACVSILRTTDQKALADKIEKKFTELAEKSGLR